MTFSRVVDTPKPRSSVAVAANQNLSSGVEEDSMGSKTQNPSITEYQQHARNPHRGNQKLGLTEKSSVDTFYTANTTEHSPGSLFSEGDEMSCSCLKNLTEYLCYLDIIERKRDFMCLDKTLSETDKTLSYIKIVLECDFCRLDSKVILLVMTVLQTVLNWVAVEYMQKTCRREIPAVQFGDWTVSMADSLLIKSILTSRILATFDSVVDSLRIRMDDMSLKAIHKDICYGFMDSEALQQTLQRLSLSLEKISEYVKC